MDIRSGAGHDRGADVDAHDRVVDSFDTRFVFEAVDLGTESVAADGDVEEVEGVLVASFDFFGEEDHAHASSPDRHSLSRAVLDGLS